MLVFFIQSYPRSTGVAVPSAPVIFCYFLFGTAVALCNETARSKIVGYCIILF